MVKYFTQQESRINPLQGINSALRARVEGAIASVEEELRLLPERLIALASEDSQVLHPAKIYKN